MATYAKPPETSRHEVVAWRKRVVSRLVGAGATQRDAEQRLRGTERQLRSIARTLHVTHGTPHLGNLRDPVSEFVYIVLSRKTAERAYRRAFERLSAVGAWSSISKMSTTRIGRLIHGCGLEGKKATAIRFGLLALEKRFGPLDLVRGTRHLGPSDVELLDFLLGLPEVGLKSALCIMLYGFGRKSFPVDAHVGRVLARLGVLDAIAPGLKTMNHKRRQLVLVDAVPPDLRYALHVNLIVHGRSLCPARSPSCRTCSIRRYCRYEHPSH